ncbi:MAG: hypothetical protein LBM96_00330 [Methanobrevibacter sp.]|jgi:hypothetical protein|nr:hypothetical protein [Candidatus Methanoflexus mossambicus]
MDTKYQRAKILVELLKSFYLQVFISLGLYIVIILRFALIYPGNYIKTNFMISQSISNKILYYLAGGNQTLIDAVNSQPQPDLSFFQSSTFLFSYIGIIFGVFIIFKFIKFYKLKSKFYNSETKDIALKKFMKMDNTPSIQDVLNKFDENNSKKKKKFYLYSIRVVILMGLLFVLKRYLNGGGGVILDVIIFFAIFNIIYRYLFTFHLDKKIFNENWEKKKIVKYLKLMES